MSHKKHLVNLSLDLNEIPPLQEDRRRGTLFNFITVEAFIVSSLAVLGLSRYLVKLESGALIHHWVDEALYQASSVFGEPDTGVFGFIRYGWSCVICVGQWISFGVLWGVTGVDPLDWSRQFWVTAVALNMVNMLAAEYLDTSHEEPEDEQAEDEADESVEVVS